MTKRMLVMWWAKCRDAIAPLMLSLVGGVLFGLSVLEVWSYWTKSEMFREGVLWKMFEWNNNMLETPEAV